jgi:deazaflavin-dependent oxidoreductase (nitroreductase family)
MWFMNKIANPFVRLILRSRLHRWMSGAVLLITYRGRKSGREYTLPVQYVQEGNVIYIVPGAAEKKTWWRNLRGGAAVNFRLRGKQLQGHATLLEGETDAEAIAEAFLRYLKRFPLSAKIHSIRIKQDGSFDFQDIRNEAKSLVIVRVDIKE